MPALNSPQAEFLALPQKFRAFVGGFGSGKTWVGSCALLRHTLTFPRVNSGYFAPSYGQIRDIFYPTIDEVAFEWGLRTSVHLANKEVALFAGRRYYSTIICRSMDSPKSIVGFKIGRALVDELDIMRVDNAATAWRKIIARLRHKADGLQNGVDVTTTPEGFKFVYQQFVKQVRENPELAELYGIVQASTYSNGQNLPDDYIPSLRASYPPQLIDAYLDGRFVNLVSGGVYPNFDRRLNHTDEIERPNEPLHVGMDFNVMNMSATINVIRDGLPITVGELAKVRDTPTMARMLNERFGDRGHAITIYPDASGGSRSSQNASDSDLAILKRAGLSVKANSSNPAVKDRVNAMNAMILNDTGERRWKVNTDRCPNLTESLEQQAYDASGEPDKQAGFDHFPDAQGYFIVTRYPIVKRTGTIRPIRGLG